MDSSEEDLDELNELTFGTVDAGDWELEHERFVLEQGEFEQNAPEADALPKFWEASDDLSIFWPRETFETHKCIPEDETKERGVDVEQTLNKLVSDDEFEDPAILDISRKVSRQKIHGSALEKILNAAAYPFTSVTLLEQSRDIWSTSECRNAVSSNGVSTTTSSEQLYLNNQRKTQLYIKPTTCESHTGVPISLNELRKLSRRQNGIQSITRHSQLQHDVSSYSSPVSCASSSHNRFVAPTLSGNDAIFGLQSPKYPDQFTPSSPASSQLLNLISAQTPGVNSSTLNLSSRSDAILTHDHASAALEMLRMNTHNFGISQCSPYLPGRGSSMLRCIAPRGCAPASQMIFPLRFPSVPPCSATVHNSTSVHPLSFSCSQSGPRSIPVSIHTSHRSPMSLSEFKPVRLDESEHTCCPGADLQETFDPSIGSWMTQYESVGVLLTHLRPLMVSNPYVQDYYYAVRWLRHMSAHRAKQIASGTLPYANVPPPPVMHMPSPVTVENLLDPTHYHHVALNHKLVLSLTRVHLTTGPKPLEVSNSDDGVTAVEVFDNAFASTMQSLRSSPDTSHTLGRATRSNVHRPRLIAELSVTSALANSTNGSDCTNLITDSSAEVTETKSLSGGTAGIYQLSARVRSARLFRLLLARIERVRCDHT